VPVGGGVGSCSDFSEQGRLHCRHGSHPGWLISRFYPGLWLILRGLYFYPDYSWVGSGCALCFLFLAETALGELSR
jgi:hypothetical protein